VRDCSSVADYIRKAATLFKNVEKLVLILSQAQEAPTHA
jgi:hypothetical protein